MADTSTDSGGATVTGLLGGALDYLKDPKKLLALANRSPQLFGAAMKMLRDPPEWLQPVIGGGLGAMDPSGVASENFWNAQAQQSQARQLRDFYTNVAHLTPEQAAAMPPGMNPAAALPSYEVLGQDLYKVPPFGGEPEPVRHISQVNKPGRGTTTTILGPDGKPKRVMVFGDPTQGLTVQELGEAPVKPESTTAKDARTQSRLDKSYQLQFATINKAAAPLEQQAERISRIVESVNQRTPEADALIAPELLTAMAGGMGSGLRMNEAEISRIVGGRTHWETLKAAANKWKLDPTKGLSITDSQREQIVALVSAMQKRIHDKLRVVQKAREDLVAADSVDEQRRIVTKAQKQLNMLSEHGLAGAKDTDSDPLKIR